LGIILAQKSYIQIVWLRKLAKGDLHEITQSTIYIRIFFYL